MLDYNGDLKPPGMRLVMVVAGDGDGEAEVVGGNGGVVVVGREGGGVAA